ISLLAFSANTAASDASSTTGSLGLAIPIRFEKTRIEGETKADSEGTINGGSLTVQALGWNQTAPFENIQSVSLLAGGSGGYVDAVITSDALIQASAGGGSINSTGAVVFDAET